MPSVMRSGFKHLRVSDPVFGGTFPAIVQYPTDVAPSGVTIDSVSWQATLDAPLAEGRFPVCVISHGAGGSHLLYRTISTHLACSGWIVVCPEAPRDNRNDPSLAYTDQSVTNRCIHIRTTLDAILDHEQFAGSADADRVGIVGHSLGGCAALALAGGQPWSRAGTPIPVEPDNRFKAAVLMAPATAFYRAPGALAKVNIPLLVLAGERDEITRADDIRDTLRPLPGAAGGEFVMVQGAGHFSFISPFPEHMRRPDFRPSQDPEGFDREQFHTTLPGIIETFLSKALQDGPASRA